MLEPKEAFAGFASSSVVMIAFLYVVAAGVKETGAATRLGYLILGGARSERGAQARLVVPVAVLSAFMNNTPLVAMFLPVLGGIARRIRVAPSRLFMPLSFATILGGTCTMIGTSTNVVIDGLVKKHGVEGLGMFGFARLGLPVALVGLLYLVLFGRKLLPAGEDFTLGDSVRKYMAMVKVRADAPLVGQTVAQANLRNLPGLYLSRIERGEEIIVAVSPNERLQGGDVLGFVGDLDSVVDLHKVDGLEPAHEEERPKYSASRRLIEAVVSPASPLIGQTIKDAEIRTRYGAVIIAVHRHGHRVEGKLGSVILKPGDSILLEGPESFLERHRNSPDFTLVSALEGAAAPNHRRAPAAIGLLVLFIVLLSVPSIDPVVAAMLVAALMGVTRCCTAPQARAAVDWQVLIVIGSAYGIATAMEKTGLAGSLAHLILEAAMPFGRTALLASIYLLTLLLTSVLTNTAAAILVFPIALSVTGVSGESFVPFAACIAIAASCEFSTPIGYQTNLMVMGPGGYRWSDFTRFGGPLTIICALVAIALAPLVF